MLKHQSELACCIERPRLTDDLGHRGSITERKHLDNDLVNIKTTLGKHCLFDFVWVCDVELAPRAPALERADDGVPVEHADALLVGFVACRSNGHCFGHALLDALKSAREPEQTRGVPDEDAVDATPNRVAFHREGAREVLCS